MRQGRVVAPAGWPPPAGPPSSVWVPTWRPRVVLWNQCQLCCREEGGPGPHRTVCAGGGGRGVAPKSRGSGRRPAGSNHIWRTGRNAQRDSVNPHSNVLLQVGGPGHRPVPLQGGKYPGPGRSLAHVPGGRQSQAPHPHTEAPTRGPLQNAAPVCALGPSLRCWTLTLTDHGPGSPIMALRRWEGVWVDYLGGRVV